MDGVDEKVKKVVADILVCTNSLCESNTSLFILTSISTDFSHCAIPFENSWEPRFSTRQFESLPALSDLGPSLGMLFFLHSRDPRITVFLEQHH